MFFFCGDLKRSANSDNGGKQTQNYDAKREVWSLIEGENEGHGKVIASNKYFDSRIFGMCKDVEMNIL